jgi:hypothetical protein
LDFEPTPDREQRAGDSCTLANHLLGLGTVQANPVGTFLFVLNPMQYS